MRNKKITKNFTLILCLSIFIEFFFWISIPEKVKCEESEQHTSVQASESHSDEHGIEPKTHANSEENIHNSEAHGNEHAPQSKFLTPEVNDIARLPILIIFLPILGAIIYLLFYNASYAIRNTILVGTAVIVFILMLNLYKYVVSGIYVGNQLYKGIYCTLPFIPNFNLTFKIDPAGYAIAMISSFVWMIAMIYNIDYMTIEKKVNRFNFFTIFSLSAQLGVLLAGDFLTLFIFFEGLVIFPYSMVAHHEDKEALSGANIFLYMSVATGLFLLMGIVLLWYVTGGIEIKAVGDILNKSQPSWLKYVMTFFLIFGFGGKAGLFFEHAWLPKAHPVAPTPGSALLSGLMIKAGAYGIFRSINLLFSPGSFSAPDWINMANIGYVMIWIGIMTMFLGIMNALLSDNSKRMLAYSSISQMGYIIVGIGCAAYLGKDGAMGLAGAIYHIINHALFKALLFMGVGAAYFRTHELNMYKLGGLWRNMPIVAITTVIAALGYGGVPLFNGFASKTLIHHAIIEAYQHSVHYSPDGKPDSWLRVAEIMFMITAGAGLVAVLKMAFLTFFGKRAAKHEKIKDVPLPMKISLTTLSAVILFIGLNPNWMLETIVGPALAYFNFDPSSHPYHIIYNVHSTGSALKSTIPILYEPVTRAFFSSSEAIHNILGGSNAILLGGMIFILGFRLRWFYLPDSKWLTIEFYYKGIYKTFKNFCTGIIVEASELVATKEIDIFSANYKAFKNFCTGGIVEASDLVSNTEVDIFKANYQAFKKFCTGGIVEASDLVSNTEIDVFSANYQAFEKFCKGSLPDIQDMNIAEVDAKLQKASLSVSNASDWFTEKEISFFRKNYDNFLKFCKGSMPDTPDVQPVFAATAGNVLPTYNDKVDMKTLSAGYRGFTRICRNTIGRMSYEINRLILFLMVDIWLATSHTRSIYKRFDDAFIAWYGGDLVVDKKLADFYMKICRESANFDYNFIDGMVNGVAWFIHTYGRGLRRIQTGYIQNYALSIVIGLIAIVTLCLIII